MESAEDKLVVPTAIVHVKTATKKIFPWKIMTCLVSVMALFCNSVSPKNSGQCNGPTINGCSGNPCEYMHIFDSNGNFIKEGSGSGAQVYWDGTDCHGNKVGCGLYTCTLFLVYNGNSQSTTSTVLVKDSNTVSKTGRTVCDSLKSACKGSYHETLTEVIQGNSIVQDVECICCQ